MIAISLWALQTPGWMLHPAHFLLAALRPCSQCMAFDSHVLQSVITKLHLNNISNGWAEARIKITRMILTIKLDRNWSSFQLANSAPPLSVTGSAIAPSARIPGSARKHTNGLRFPALLYINNYWYITAGCCVWDHTVEHTGKYL